jgi:cysteine-rich repeat protein
VLVGDGTIDSFSLGFRARSYRCVAGNLSYTDRDGTLTATNTPFSLEAMLSVASGQGVFDVTDFTVDLDLTLTLDCTLQFICNLIEATISPSIEAAIEDGIEDAGREGITGIALEGFIGDSVITSRVVVPPPPISITLDLVAELDSALVDTDRIHLGSNVQAHPNSRGASIPASAPGSIRRGGPSSTFDLVPYELGNASHDDVLNQLLWALWYGGGLDIPDLTGEAERQGVVLSQFTHETGLPQVLMPGGAPDRVEIGKGDTLFTLEGDLADLAPPISGPLVVSGYWSSLVGGHITVDERGKRLQFVPDAAQARVQILTLNQPALKAFVVPILEERFAAVDVLFVERTLALFEMPRVDSTEVDGAAGFELSIANTAVDRPGDDALRITGDLIESAICGDGVVLALETCDDGNASGGDGCSASCEVEPPYTCSGEPSFCTSTCGDFVLDAGEACDDGGLVDGDGCSRTCQLQDDHRFFGTAVGGGEVQLTIDGQAIVVATVAGESSAAIAQKVANAINWSVPHVAAGATGNQLYVNGTLSDVVITDPGLTCSLPVLGLLGRLALLGALGLGASRRLQP